MIALIEEVVRLRHTIAAGEQRRSRHIGHASDIAAVASTAAFAQAHLPTATSCPDARSTLRLATSMVAVPGMALEFGVASGSSLTMIAAQLRGRRIYGFDVFTGLPEDWRAGFPAGAFAQRPPVVAGANIIEGLFEDVLPEFMARHGDPVAFLYLDADLYSSTATALEHVGSRLVEGSVVVFDEYFNYPNWQEHEHKA